MMLPSTGKFKEINCPFYNSTLCERPYCHFRHVKKDLNEGSAPGSASLSLPEDGVILQQLVSEAVRKVLQRTEIIPGALTNKSPTHQVESVSDSLVNKVVEELTPPLTVSGSSQSSNDNSVNAFSAQPKIPSYKPTPISVLKRRHIPIPYSPSLSKNSCILRKRTNSNETVPVFKKFRIEPPDRNGFATGKSPVSTLTYSSESNSRKELANDVNACEVAQYSPAPVSGWKSSGLSYTPSSIESLSSKHNPYVPSSRTSAQPSGVSYEPSDKSTSAVEPSYEPVNANGLRVKGASYEPSTVSKSEPEYQPAFSDVNAKEYVPTNISKLGSIIDSSLSSDIDLLHDILQKDLTGSDSEDHVNRETVLNTQVDVLDSKVKLNSEKVKSDCSAQKIDDKRPRELEKKKSDNASSSSKKRSEDKKKDDTKRREETEKKIDDCRKKKLQEKSKSISEKKESSEEKKKESEKKRNDHEKKRSIESKKNDSEKRKGNDDKKKSDSEKRKRHSEIDRKNEDGKKLTHNEKKSDSSKKHSDSDKKSSDSEKRGESDKKREQDKKSESSSDSHNKSSRKRDNKKRDVNKSSRDAAAKSRSKHDKEFMLSLKTKAKRKLSGSADKEKSGKMESKQRIENHQKRFEWSDAALAEIVHSGAVSDSEISEAMEALADVTLPDDSWASSSDEETITKQCFRIFQEYDPSVAKKKAPSYKPPLPVEDGDPQVSKRKRVAHDNAESSKMLRPPPSKRLGSVNPAQALTERYRKLKEAARSASTDISSAVSSTTSTVGTTSLASNKQVPAIETKGVSTQTQITPFPAGGKVRIAHVPNVNVLLNAKIKMQQQLKERQLSVSRPLPSTSTIAQTVPKGVQRVAHMPSDQTLSRPVICDLGGKIPANVRQKYLNMLVDEYLKISPAEQEAYEKAQEEEQSIHSRSTTRNLYVSHVTNTISRLRKSAAIAGGSSKASEFRPVANRIVSHTSVLAGKGGAKGSWSIEKPRKPPSNVTGKSLYEQFAHFTLSEEQLKENGFPMPHPQEKGLAEIHAFFKQPFKPKSSNQRMCARCSRIYYVNNQGFAVKEEQCVYHWGRLFQSKTRGGWEARYNCCQSHAEGVGCSVGACHVSDNFDPNNLRGFVKTLPKESPPADGNFGIYALDCEMCYTTVGLELTRVTVVGSDLHVVYEALVKPENPILDYNTRFSGIKEEDLQDVSTNIYEVQSVLLSFINDKSILVGHSLESDFKALKLIHCCVVDTSVVYPHKMGPPKKRALKSLCRELLQKIIQESEGGHDSAEDARAAMEVMLFKVKEEAKNW